MDVCQNKREAVAWGQLQRAYGPAIALPDSSKLHKEASVIWLSVTIG